MEELAQSRLGATLQDLSLPCHAAAVGGLAALTRLTALEVNTWASDSFEGLTCLTHLRSLYIHLFNPCPWTGEGADPGCLAPFAPLTVLTGLTSLVLRDGEDGIRDHFEWDPEMNWPRQHSWMSGLSAMTALRTLGFCHLPIPTGIFGRTDGRTAFPSDLLVLRSAQDLQVLDLTFDGLFWAQMDGRACRALQAAVAGLTRLTEVSLTVLHSCWPQKYFIPLAVFTAAPSLHALAYFAEDFVPDEEDDMEQSPRRTREAEGIIPCSMQVPDLQMRMPDCLKGCTLLRELNLHGSTPVNLVSLPVPRCVEILAGLGSSQLTSLRLRLGSLEAALTQQIARFSHLQELRLVTDWMVRHSLPPLTALTGLTQLFIRSIAHYGRGAGRALEKEADMLEDAIFESASSAGLIPNTTILLGDPV